MTTTMLRFLLAASTLSDDELAELATMLEIAVEDEKDDIRVVHEETRNARLSDMSVDRLAEVYIDAAGQLEGIKLRTAMARKLLPAWSE